MPLQTPADASNKHNRRPTSTRINAEQLSNIRTMHCFRIYQCFFFPNSWFPLPRFLCFRPSPGYAVCSTGIPWAAREVTGRQVDGQATREVCSQLTCRLSASPHGQPHVGTTWPLLQLFTVSHFNSFSSISPQYVWCSPTTLLLQSDLKLHQVPKISSHWHQRFRGWATISRNIYPFLFASFTNHSKSTVY